MRLEGLTLRRRVAPSRRVATNMVLAPILRDATLRVAPQDEVISYQPKSGLGTLDACFTDK